jgi:hypothetical protein
MEIIANAVQTVAPNQNVLFTDSITCGNCSISHRSGSGLITLRGITNQCRARYKVTFGANIAIPTGGTVGPIQIALSIDGEAIPTTTAIVTPAAVEEYFNVFTAIFIDVPRDCCLTVSVKNITTDEDILVQNANLIVERMA